MGEKTIDTLGEDIYRLLDSDSPTTPDIKLGAEFAMGLAGEVGYAMTREGAKRKHGKLWASDLGEPCARKNWFKWNSPESGEGLQGHTRFKFLYGNVLESLVLYLAKEAGHSVTHEQERYENQYHLYGENWTVSGRIDAVIDDILVDVKSTSSYGYKKYKEFGIATSNDTFNYLYQLGWYRDRVEESGEVDYLQSIGFVFVDKQNGHVSYIDAHRTAPSALEIDMSVKYIVDSVSAENFEMLLRAYDPQPYGKSGNMQLPIECQYCDFKRKCWEGYDGGPGVRTFLYSHGPVHLVKVENEPKVPELLVEKTV